MTLYRCNVCNVFEYDPVRRNSLTNIRPGTEPAVFPDGWKCPICASDKTHIRPVPAHSAAAAHRIPCPC
jgi:rubredoxin